MRDVAARAGVSLKTVSRVVNDEAGVSPALVGRVRQAVDDLGFRPNVGASVLRRADARTASVGLLLDDVADPFSATVLRAVQDAAQARGVVVLSAIRPKSKSTVDLDRLEHHFASRCRAVARIPYDAHLEEGAEIELELLASDTAEAYLVLAAIVGDGLPWPRRLTSRSGLP